MPMNEEFVLKDEKISIEDLLKELKSALVSSYATYCTSGLLKLNVHFIFSPNNHDL